MSIATTQPKLLILTKQVVVQIKRLEPISKVWWVTERITVYLITTAAPFLVSNLNISKELINNEKTNLFSSGNPTPHILLLLLNVR
jgi:hypothetical protein